MTDIFWSRDMKAKCRPTFDLGRGGKTKVIWQEHILSLIVNLTVTSTEQIVSLNFDLGEIPNPGPGLPAGESKNQGAGEGCVRNNASDLQFDFEIRINKDCFPANPCGISC